MPPFQPSPFWNASPFGAPAFGVPGNQQSQEKEKTPLQKWMSGLSSEIGNALSGDLSWLSGEPQKPSIPGMQWIGGMPQLQAPRMWAIKPIGKPGAGSSEESNTPFIVGGILIGLILLWGLPAISAFNPELLQQYHFLISIKATSDTLYGKIGLHTGLMIPLVAGLGFMAFNRKWHPFLSLPALALASATAYYFATEGTMLAQQLGSAGASKIGTAAFFLTGFAIASFLGAIGFFRKEVVEISQKMQVTPLTMGLWQNQNKQTEKKETVMSKAIEAMFIFSGKKEEEKPANASPFGGLPGIPGIGGGLPGLMPMQNQNPQTKEKLPVAEWKFIKVPFYVMATVAIPAIIFGQIPASVVLHGLDFGFVAIVSSAVALLYIGGKTMLLTPEFFMTPSVWFKEPEPEPVAAPAPKVETKTYVLSWQEELRDKIQEIITEQKFDGVYLGDYTEAATTIAYDVELPKSLNFGTFKLKLAMMGELLKDEEGNTRALMYRNGKIECTKDKQYCKRLFLETTTYKGDIHKGIMQRWEEEDPEGFNDDDSVLIGEDTKGELVVAKLQKLPHITVLGGSSSGKSKSFHAMFYPILSRNTPETIRLALADPKSELARYKNLGFLWRPLSSTGEEVEKMLQDAYDEGDRRIETFKNSVESRTFDNIINYNRYCRDKGLPILPKIIIAIDELADFTANLCQSNNKEDQERGRNIMNLLTRISKKHRAQGLHLFIATQRGDASVIPTGARGQMSFLSVWMAENDARLVLEENSGTDRLVKQTGDALFKYADKALTRVQTAFIDEDEHLAKIKEWEANPYIGTFHEEVITLSWQEELRDGIIDGLKKQRTSGIELGDYSEAKMTVTYDATISSGAKIENIRKALDNLSVSFGGKTFNLVTQDGKNYLEVSKPAEYQSKLFMHDRIITGVRTEGFMEKARRLDPEKYADQYQLLLGEDQQGNPVYYTFDRLPHLVIMGGSSSGKSKAYHGLLYGILARNTPKNIQLVLADPKTELHIYSNLGFMWHPMVRSPQELLIALERVCAEGEARISKITEAGASDIKSYNSRAKAKWRDTLPIILVAIDELADYTDALKKDKSSSEMKALAAKIEKCLTEIAKKHRSQGIHLFVATQRPDASVISPGYRGQLSTVVSVWIPEKDGALILWPNSGADKLVKQTGDALVKFSDNPPIRVQFPYIDNVELEDKIDEWRENPEIGPAPDFDFFVEKGDALYAKGAVDLEPKPLDYNRVIHILPEKLRQKDNIFLNRDFKKLCSQLAREPFGWNTKFLKRVYKSVQTFDTIETTLCMYGILKNTSEKATPAYELSCDLKGIGYAFERFGMPNFEKLNNHQIMMEFGDAIGFGESDGFIDDSDRQFVFKETISQRVLNNRNVSQEKKESFIYDILKLIILNLQNSSTEGAELTYNLDKYPDPTPEEEDEESTEDSDDGNDRVGNMPTLSQKEKDDVAPQSDEPDDEEEEVHIPTMESILSNAKKSAVSAKSVIAIAQLALIDIETVGAVDVDSILEITEGDRELCDRVLEYLVDNGEIVEDDINGGYRYIAGDESLIYDELDEESEEVELPEEYRIKEEESSEPPTSSPEASEEEPEEEPSTPDSRSDEEEEKQEEEAIAPVKEIIEKKPEPKQEAPKVPQSILDDFDAIVE